MAIILNIDTATETASVCICYNTEVLSIAYSNEQKNHAAFVQPAIQQILQKTNTHIAAIDAVAVTGGPGSYTGLRVGLATAKGICYALQKPLIIENTLRVMAQAALATLSHYILQNTNTQWLLCPMIDARRMEVFTAVYQPNLMSVSEPAARILEEHCYNNLLKDHHILFFGSGSIKWKKLIQHPNAQFAEISQNAGHLGVLAYQAWRNKQWVNLAYATPFYLKEFYHPKKNYK
ncbi:MAG: tRNA (adenosine(37)-N6)-threonylcarbamoyltransferase complex dimerization subunit type 1 TsaB [Hydrotalea flava]|uniref:tRNA (adenosine(37)-N6)-threonylcarbamoyltransferase complex dimerization subunit type 1 TsaB n=1 Tax=Hydrotalea TaxID=1004300 RepID=UPI0009434513|nr:MULTISPECIES: tRNA (adenosine(37)-N6)-threonylcarbamoyltransferase complex dimerization subunit type 1 TsaB [Hydrotalea]MBY0349122.1 tRNA (adenosine(37)-N6)-threonylcarbamoyltransferase complex dimerization subunit type 1 TsaB [Hydrotalea flava]NIM35718.1 tRNA (adenosine(37)-N6)-threonylcarbamoyltransferase complex dimerization subunit type 1 TsaB [Hydrotalea flava]NIM38577.1 tRNA (adenosine(37)-N6)-threonylcarbamoyltransferase complex dimerization subunit type 1 TsaB [Hydrotalea flava]NIN03